MRNDPIVAKIRKVRDEYAAKFNYDLNAMFQDIKRQERESGRTFVSKPPKATKRRTTPRKRRPKR